MDPLGRAKMWFSLRREHDFPVFPCSNFSTFLEPSGGPFGGSFWLKSRLQVVQDVPRPLFHYFFWLLEPFQTSFFWPRRGKKVVKNGCDRNFMFDARCFNINLAPWHFWGPSWGPFGVHFGPIWGPFLGPEWVSNRTPNGPSYVLIARSD